MKKFEGLNLPESLEEITIKEFSNINKIINEYNLEEEGIDELELEIRSYRMNADIVQELTGISDEQKENTDLGIFREYMNRMSFLKGDRKPLKLDSFTFKGKTYHIEEDLKGKTKFGQYVEALQIQANSHKLDKNSLEYLAHQLAHQVNYGEEWDEKTRDALAIDFLDLPCTVCLDFAFFLQSRLPKYKIVSYLAQADKAPRKESYTKEISARLVGLKLYLNWRNWGYLISRTRLRLIVYYILIREKFYSMFRLPVQKEITNTKLAKTLIKK